MTSKKRVVITGMGIVSSIGNNLEEVKDSLINQNQELLNLILTKKWALEVKYTVK